MRDVAKDPRPGDVASDADVHYPLTAEILSTCPRGVRVRVSYEVTMLTEAWEDFVRSGTVVIRGAEPSPNKHQ